jgi:hypothetical protein
MFRKVLTGLALTTVTGAVLILNAQAAPPDKSSVSVEELKTVRQFKDSFNKQVNSVITRAEANKPAPDALQNWIVSTKIIKGIVSTKFIKYDKALATTLTLEDVRSVQKKVNARLDAMLKKGQLTASDRQLIKLETINDLQKHLK